MAFSRKLLSQVILLWEFEGLDWNVPWFKIIIKSIFIMDCTDMSVLHKVYYFIEHHGSHTSHFQRGFLSQILVKLVQLLFVFSMDDLIVWFFKRPVFTHELLKNVGEYSLALCYIMLESVRMTLRSNSLVLS